VFSKASTALPLSAISSDGAETPGYQQLAENGYMLLAERARREDDKGVFKEVIEQEMKVKIDEKMNYNLHNSAVDFTSYLDCPIPSLPLFGLPPCNDSLSWLRGLCVSTNPSYMWEKKTRCVKKKQKYADAVSRRLYSLNRQRRRYP
jgi:midasin